MPSTFNIDLGVEALIIDAPTEPALNSNRLWLDTRPPRAILRYSNGLEWIPVYNENPIISNVNPDSSANALVTNEGLMEYFLSEISFNDINKELYSIDLREEVLQLISSVLSARLFTQARLDTLERAVRNRFVGGLLFTDGSDAELRDDTSLGLYRVGTRNLVDNSISGVKFENEIISSEHLESVSITSEKIEESALLEHHFANNSIETDNVEDGSIDHSKLSFSDELFVWRTSASIVNPSPNFSNLAHSVNGLNSPTLFAKGIRSAISIRLLITSNNVNGDVYDIYCRMNSGYFATIRAGFIVNRISLGIGGNYLSPAWNILNISNRESQGIYDDVDVFQYFEQSLSRIVVFFLFTSSELASGLPEITIENVVSPSVGLPILSQRGIIGDYEQVPADEWGSCSIMTPYHGAILPNQDSWREREDGYIHNSEPAPSSLGTTFVNPFLSFPANIPLVHLKGEILDNGFGRDRLRDSRYYILYGQAPKINNILHSNLNSGRVLGITYRLTINSFLSPTDIRNESFIIHMSMLAFGTLYLNIAGPNLNLPANNGDVFSRSDITEFATNAIGAEDIFGMTNFSLLSEDSILPSIPLLALYHQDNTFFNGGVNDDFAPPTRSLISNETPKATIRGPFSITLEYLTSSYRYQFSRIEPTFIDGLSIYDARLPFN